MQQVNLKGKLQLESNAAASRGQLKKKKKRANYKLKQCFVIIRG